MVGLLRKQTLKQRFANRCFTGECSWDKASWKGDGSRTGQSAELGHDAVTIEDSDDRNSGAGVIFKAVFMKVKSWAGYCTKSLHTDPWGGGIALGKAVSE